MEKIKRFLKEEEGVTAIEYGLIAAGIAVAIVAIVFTIGSKLVTHSIRYLKPEKANLQSLNRYS